MVDDAQQAKDDIAYVKGFLKGDGPAPAVIGHFYLVTGLAGAFHALREYLLHQGWLSDGILTMFKPWDTLGIWVIGLSISSFVMRWRGQTAADTFNPHDKSRATQAGLASWGALNLAALVGIPCLYLSGMEGATIAAMILFSVVWGAGWTITHAIHRVGWHAAVAWGFYVLAVAIALLAGKPLLPLVIGVALLLLFALPGYLIIRDARAQR